ncbi:MAG TPA: protease pro-enzyme activation domain-containing protein [Acidimicrobiales bacterium]|jgi:hypothetical protein|nr:protease pro-enzyme activation domain-containing protein [Acidimicrobiales bacterium]
MRTQRGVRPLIISVVAATSLLAVALPSAAFAARGPAGPQARVIVAPQLPAGAHVIGSTPSSQRLEASVFLLPRSVSALAAFAAQVSNVHSPLFRHYLRRGEFAARFGPTSTSLRSVESFVHAAGLHVDSLSSNHLVLSISGTVRQFSGAFSTTFTNVRLASGALGRTNSAVRLPGLIAPSVAAVIGLNDLLRPHTSLERHNMLRRPTIRGIGHRFSTVPGHGAPGAPSACPAAVGTTQLGFGGITDDQVSNAYGVDGLYTAGDLGQGQTVAIYELEPFSTSDIAAFDTCYFGSSHTSQIRAVNVDGGPGTGTGSGESALDIENVSAIAPSAKILVYQAPNTEAGSIDAYNRIVSDDLAQSASSSWGFCEADALTYSPGSLAAENMIFEQAAAQGQTVFNSSGDGGNDSCSYQNGFPTAPVETEDDPASQPYVVGVGGTTAVSVAQPPQEQVWNDGANGGGGGGGISRLWEQPAWMPASANALSSKTPCNAPAGEVCRTVPDVTGFADEYTGITVYIGGGWTTIGGTSSSSPFWAAMLAEINASSTCQASASTERGVGFASPLLYQVASNPTDYASGFNDITTGNNDIYNTTGGTFKAGVGYDLASGLGSPELTAAPHVVGPGLAASLCAAALGTTTAKVSSIAPASGSASGGTPFVITGSGFKPGGTSDVAQVTFGTSPAATFVVASGTKITGTTSTETTPTTNSTLNGVTNHTGGVLVSVTTTNKEVAVGPTFHFVVQHAGSTVPLVLQVGPTGGPGKGGNTVEIDGSGFTGATKVTFGGVSATFKVHSDVLISAVAPKWRASQCLKASNTGKLGLCQTQVQVTGHGGASKIEAAKKPYAGYFNFSNLGVLLVPPGCGCEGYPTISEYDYATSYSLSRVTNPNGKPILGDPNGGNEVVFDGAGLNVLTLDWVNFGAAGSASSTDFELLQISAKGTSLSFFSFGDQNPTVTGNKIPVSFETVAGASNTKQFSFAAIQDVTSLSTDVLPSAGGTAFVINGGGFLGVNKATEVIFSGNGFATPPVSVLPANFKVVSGTEITLTSPSMVPGSYTVLVCGQYTCGAGAPNTPVTSTVDVIFPGTTAVTSAEAFGGASPSGPTSGGSNFVIQGANFGPLADLTVYLVNGLGETFAAATPSAGPSATDPGATQSIVVTSPAALGGYPGVMALVVVGDNGTSAETPTALFTYTS